MTLILAAGFKILILKKIKINSLKNTEYMKRFYGTIVFVTTVSVIKIRSSNNQVNRHLWPNISTPHSFFFLNCNYNALNSSFADL
jgi:hypothetical protein